MGNENWGVPYHVEPVVSATAEMLHDIRIVRIGPWVHNPWTVEALSSGRYDSGL